MNIYISDLFFNYEPAVAAKNDGQMLQAACDFIGAIKGAFGVSIDIDELINDFNGRELI